MKRKDTFIVRNVGGENLLVPIGSQVANMNGFVLLNTTGQYLWELLSVEYSLDELATSLAEHFDIGHERALEDVQIFLDQIGAMGLLNND